MSSSWMQDEEATTVTAAALPPPQHPPTRSRRHKDATAASTAHPHKHAHSRDAPAHRHAHAHADDDANADDTAAAAAASASAAQTADGISSSAHASPPSLQPTCLFTEGYPYSVRILSDRLSVMYIQRAMHALDVGTVRSNLPIPKARTSAVFYYEVEIKSTGERNHITVGIAPLHSPCLFAPANMHDAHTPAPSQASLRQHETVSLTCRQVGLDLLSYGYRGDEGKKFHGQTVVGGRATAAGVAYGPSFSAGDVIGCGINFNDSTVFFTRNGRNLGVAFTLDPNDWNKEMKSAGDSASTPTTLNANLDFYAAISLHSKGEHIKCNFGASPFVFDIDSFQASEKQRIASHVAEMAVDSALLLPLIRSYLLSQGYERSLVALDAVSGDSNRSAAAAPATATAMTDGDTAMHVDSNGTPSKRAQTFSSSSSAAVATNGSAHAAHAAAAAPIASRPQTQHDRIAQSTLHDRCVIRELIENGQVDEAMTHITRIAPNLWSDASVILLSPPFSILALQFRLQALQFIALLTAPTSNKAHSVHHHHSSAIAPQNLLAAIEFAQREFARYSAPPADANVRRELDQLMGLVAYADVNASPLAHLLTPAYRTQTADAVNSAILASLCAASSSEVANDGSQLASTLHSISPMELAVRHAVAIEVTMKAEGVPIAAPSVTEIIKQSS